MTKTDTVEAPEAPASNQQFGQQCMDLLCQQENTLWLLGQANEKARNSASIELMSQMLLQFLDFAETHFDSDEFDTIAQPLHEAHTHTAEHKSKLNAHSWKLMRSIVGLDSPKETDIRTSYKQLGKKHVEMFEAFFRVCQNRLPQDAEEKATFDEAANVFLAELRDKW